MGLIKYIGSILLLITFTFAIISLSVGFANDNSASVNLGDDAVYSTLNSSLISETVTFIESENDSNEAFAAIEIEGSGQTTPTGGQFKTRTVSPGKMLGSVSETIKTRVFGGDAGFGVVLTILFGFITMVGVFYVWKLWAGRNPD